MTDRLLMLAALAVLGLLAACDSVDAGEFKEEYVVEAYLVANEPLGTVRLSRTAPLDVDFDATALAVSNAQVAVEALAPDGSVTARYVYAEVDTIPGLYRAVRGSIAEPLRTYRLDVTTPDGSAIGGETTVPGAFEVLAVNADTLVYQGGTQLEIVVTRSQFPGRDQTYFTVVTTAAEVREDLLVPFAASLFEEADDLTLEDLETSGSPPFNEGNFDINPDNTLTIAYPWFGVAFYGLNHISLNAVDDNLYDFLRSGSIQQGGSTFSPGEIPDVITRLDGAVGIFGSYARVQVDLFVVPRPEL